MADFGINDGWTELASPLLSDPSYLVAKNTYPWQYIGSIWADLGGDLGYQLAGDFVPADAFPHFPFGFNVQPDLHT